nr:hypothetical protein [Tanacetum cinerariifolium]
MASKQQGSGPELHGLTLRHISLGLVLNQATSTLAKPPIKNDWDVLFQPMFNEYFKPPSAVSTPISTTTLLPLDTTEASSSTSINKDAPYPSTSLNNETTSPPINSTNVEEPHNEEDAMFDSDTFTNPFAPLVTSSAESSSRIVDTSNMYTLQQPYVNTKIWTNDYPGIFINQSKYALEMLKKYSLDQCDPVNIPMVKRLKLDEDPNGTLVHLIRYQGMVRSLMYLIASRPDIVFVVCMCARYQAKPIEKHLTTVKRVFQYLKGTINMGMWYPKETEFDLTAFVDTDPAEIPWMQSHLTDYGFDYKKIPWYCDSQSAIALSCNIVQHFRTEHIVVRYHFIKEQVEIKIVELYFVKTAYQLADIFTKLLARERFEFLVKCLGMQSIMHEELKLLAELDVDA